MSKTSYAPSKILLAPVASRVEQVCHADMIVCDPVRFALSKGSMQIVSRCAGLSDHVVISVRKGMKSWLTTYEIVLIAYSCHHGRNCPPCDQPCQLGCSHGKCKLKCHEVCDPCTRRCNRACDHEGHCEALCSLPCSIVPCNEPCEKGTFSSACFAKLFHMLRFSV
jgi:hypothetical protein